MPFGVDPLHYKSPLNWPDVAKLNTPSGFFFDRVNEFSVYDGFCRFHANNHSDLSKGPELMGGNTFPDIIKTLSAWEVCIFQGWRSRLDDRVTAFYEAELNRKKNNLDKRDTPSKTESVCLRELCLVQADTD